MLNMILLADDNVHNLRLVEKILKNKGYQVVLTHNGAEALEAARKTLPDIVVSDIMMPVMDGFAFCQKWNQDTRLKSIPFVFYTATYTDSRDEALAMSLGAARFIVKPVEPEVFLNIIQSVLDEFQRGAAILPSQTLPEEEVILTSYNQALVRKLEQKVREMKEINLKLENEIRQRNQAEQALQQSEAKLQRVFAALTGGIVIIDMDGKIIDCNANTFNMAGIVNKEGMIGKNIIDFLAEEDKIRAGLNIRITVEKGSSFNNRYTVIQPGGTRLPIEVCSCVAKDSSGAPLFLVISFMDITERIQMEEQIIGLYQQEKKQNEELQKEAKARGLFIDVLAHELRTPLTPLLVSADMLNEMIVEHPDELQKRLVTNIVKSAQTLGTRLEELLELGNYSRGTFRLKLDVVDLAKLVREVAAEFQTVLAKQSQLIELEVPDNLPPVEADPSRLEQVFVNLISNASKFSPQGGRICLKINRQNEHMHIDVTDEGLGITEEEQARLFQPYHRVEQDRQKFPGIGLGLAVCKQIIEAHRGKIWVTSQPGKGSTFSFILPLKPSL
jgi:two-component system, cell cycle sensor histidine kinase and response regulator CckA